MPFRQAHEVVGKVVTYCLNKVMALEDVSLKRLQMFSPLFGKDVYESLKLGKVINSRSLVGGTARRSVLREIAKAKKDLGL
jgi:argininosuccinate lyase